MVNNNDKEGKVSAGGDGINSISQKCAKSEKPFVRFRKFFGPISMKPLTPLERLFQYNNIGNLNTSALGAAD